MDFSRITDPFSWPYVEIFVGCTKKRISERVTNHGRHLFTQWDLQPDLL